MKSRKVVFSDRAKADLSDIYEWISAEGTWRAAGRYIDRLERFCLRLDVASERGTVRDDVSPGIRVIGFERSVSVVIRVRDDELIVVRLLKRGRDWERDFAED